MLSWLACQWSRIFWQQKSIFCMSFSLHNFLEVMIITFYLNWHHWEVMALLKYKLVLEMPLACARSHWQPKPTNRPGPSRHSASVCIAEEETLALSLCNANGPKDISLDCLSIPWERSIFSSAECWIEYIAYWIEWNEMQKEEFG